MRNKKALLSILLTVCILVGLVPTFTFAASAAEKQIITHVKVTGIDAPVTGAVPDRTAAVTTNLGPDAIEFEIVWQTYLTFQGCVGKMAEDVFTENGRYAVFVGMLPNEGYEFADVVTVTINGHFVPSSPYRFDGTKTHGRSAKYYFGEYSVDKTYTVAFDTNGIGTAPASQTVMGGRRAVRPNDPSAEGYTFVGWFADKSCTKYYNFTMSVMEDITVYGKWLPGENAEFDKWHEEGVDVNSNVYRDEFPFTTDIERGPIHKFEGRDNVLPYSTDVPLVSTEVDVPELESTGNEAPDNSIVIVEPEENETKVQDGNASADESDVSMNANVENYEALAPVVSSASIDSVSEIVESSSAAPVIYGAIMAGVLALVILTVAIINGRKESK